MTSSEHRRKQLNFLLAVAISTLVLLGLESVAAVSVSAEIAGPAVSFSDRRALDVGETGSIAIVKDADPADGADFPFTIAGLAQPPFLRKWGESGSGAGQFQSPTGVAVDQAGNVYVADLVNHRIQKFAPDGDFISMWGWGVDTGVADFEICTAASLPCQAGILGSGNGQFLAPNGVAVDESGNVYVADLGNNRIQKFTAEGNFMLEWGSAGSDVGQFINPNGLGVDTSGFVYVADTFNNRIQRFDSDGEFTSMWGWGVNTGAVDFEICTAASQPCQAGIVGSGDGQFFSPTEVAVGGLGGVYVADWNNDRIQVFDTGGNFVTKWGSSGSGNGQFMAPTGVAVDGSGNVYVADTDDHRIQKFDPDGTFLGKWGVLGNDDGQFDEPNDLIVDAAGTIFVADTDNQRIQAFAPNSDFVLDDAVPDDGDAISESITFPAIATGTYTITELIPAGWNLDAISCQSNDASDSPIIGADHVVIDLDADESITCTFENVQIQPDAPQVMISQEGDDVVLDWNDVMDATSYRVYRSLTPYFSLTTPYAETDASTFVDPGVATQTTDFFYLVTAVSAANNGSAPSNEVGVFNLRLEP